MAWTGEQKQRISVAYTITKNLRGVSTEVSEKQLFLLLLSLDPPPPVLLAQIRNWIIEARQQQLELNQERDVQKTASTIVVTNLTELEGQLP